MSVQNDVVTMRPVQGGLEIKPGQTVVLKPESFHIMLLGLKQPLAKGDHLKATLEFAKAGTVEVDFAVEDAGAPGPGGGAGEMAGMDPMN